MKMMRHSSRRTIIISTPHEEQSVGPLGAQCLHYNEIKPSPHPPLRASPLLRPFHPHPRTLKVCYFLYSLIHKISKMLFSCIHSSYIAEIQHVLFFSNGNAKKKNRRPKFFFASQNIPSSHCFTTPNISSQTQIHSLTFLTHFDTPLDMENSALLPLSPAAPADDSQQRRQSQVTLVLYKDSDEEGSDNDNLDDDFHPAPPFQAPLPNASQSPDLNKPRSVNTTALATPTTGRSHAGHNPFSDLMMHPPTPSDSMLSNQEARLSALPKFTLPDTYTSPESLGINIDPSILAAAGLTQQNSHPPTHTNNNSGTGNLLREDSNLPEVYQHNPKTHTKRIGTLYDPEGKSVGSLAQPEDKLSYSNKKYYTLHHLQPPGQPPKETRYEYLTTAEGIPKSPYLQYYHQNGQDYLQFANTLTFDEACRQALAGQYAVKRVMKFLEQWCAAEMKALDSQLSILVTEANKSGHTTATPTAHCLNQLQLSNGKPGISRNCGKLTGEFFDSMTESQNRTVAFYHAFNEEVYNRRQRVVQYKKIIKTLKSSAETLLDAPLKAAMAEYKAASDTKAKELSVVRKLEKEALQLMDKAKAQQEKESGRRLSFLSGINEAFKRLSLIAEQYQAAVNQGNAAIQTYTQQCHNLLNKVAQIEANRIILLNHTISQVMIHTHISHNTIQKIYEDSLYRTLEIDPNIDMQPYLSQRRRFHGVPVGESQLTYVLAASPNDIKQGKLHTNPNNPFCISLKAALKLPAQAKQDPNHAGVPYICTALIADIKRLNGVNAEGVFRLAHQQNELQMLREKFETGDYTLPAAITSPHAPAGLLKQWLRSLTDSIIPVAVYNDWINVAAKKINPPTEENVQAKLGIGGATPLLTATPNPLTPTAAASPSAQTQFQSALIFGVDQETETILMGLFNQLEAENKALITQLATLCVEIAHPINSTVNKMTIHNLAIVFSQSLFRNPSHDPNDIMLNSKLENKITSALLAVVGLKNYQQGLKALDEQYNKNNATAAAAANGTAGGQMSPLGLRKGFFKGPQASGGGTTTTTTTTAGAMTPSHASTAGSGLLGLGRTLSGHNSNAPPVPPRSTRNSVATHTDF